MPPRKKYKGESTKAWKSRKKKTGAARKKANKAAIATHDEGLLEDIEDLIPHPSVFEYEFLYGIRRDIQEKFKKRGYKVRIYVPFGEDWMPYTVRRLKEWKKLIFVVKNIFKEWCK